MTLVSFLILLVIAGVCGALGQAIVGHRSGGLLYSIAIGFIGALLGIWLAGKLGLSEVFSVRVGGKKFPVVWSIIGSTLLAGLIGLLSRRRHS
jgi:uncharacterized membrane protein YeaQ/YmgE (transglycosylase-associated protein family)